MKKIALMTHVVAGYRTIEESMALIRIMSDKHVDYIEVQIPFSDPIGDGSTITMANQYALSHGMTVSKSFDLIGAITAMTATPIIIMTYLNIVYAMGYECFFALHKSEEYGE